MVLCVVLYKMGKKKRNGTNIRGWHFHPFIHTKHIRARYRPMVLKRAFSIDKNTKIEASRRSFMLFVWRWFAIFSLLLFLALLNNYRASLKCWCCKAHVHITLNNAYAEWWRVRLNTIRNFYGYLFILVFATVALLSNKSSKLGI